jgi:hypothetical protein
MVHAAQGLQFQPAELLPEVLEGEALIGLDFVAHRRVRTL